MLSVRSSCCAQQLRLSIVSLAAGRPLGGPCCAIRRCGLCLGARFSGWELGSPASPWIRTLQLLSSSCAGLGLAPVVMIITALRRWLRLRSTGLQPRGWLTPSASLILMWQRRSARRSSCSRRPIRVCSTLEASAVKTAANISSW